MKEKDIRWVQRFSNYQKALRRLDEAIEIVSRKWKVMKDYAEYQGYTDVRGSRDAFRKALEMGLIQDRRWMESIEDRNLISHNYDDETAHEINRRIVLLYHPLFQSFEKEMLVNLRALES